MSKFELNLRERNISKEKLLEDLKRRILIARCGMKKDLPVGKDLAKK